MCLNLYQISHCLTTKSFLMLDQLLDMLRQNGQESVINNPQVPNEHNDGVLLEAQSSIVSVLKGMVAGGHASQVSTLAADEAHPAMQPCSRCNTGLWSGSLKNSVLMAIPPKTLPGH
jgi:hypothetical protein